MLSSNWKSRIIIAITITLLMIVTNDWTGKDYEFPLAPHIITSGNGKPAHDIPITGLQERYRQNQDLDLTMALNYTDYHFEWPSRLLKLTSANEINAKVLGIIIDADEEKKFTLNDQLKPYVAAGIGVTFINAEALVKISRGWQLFY
ncbi:MAG: hypothetical protein U9Q05_02555 [Thermodesulfobacteriota bacterium]|nr:hypothetical protein [Thermodesulfobacteriota bacterium]